ncbi:restriction endonuclease [Robertmurraya sp. FSL R5-0851]|uniref:restriction endonuclease n=1 Tax=Robertmurraya sp. FSL R5-0851 TaxID=2921584 RepID=UPI0030FC4F19
MLIAVIIVLMTILIMINDVQKRNKALLELEEKLSKAGINEIDEMTGVEFEHYLSILLKKYGYQVRITPGSNDFGADLILEGSERVVVQAKRYKRKVGIKAVQEINSARTYYKAKEAWVITNNYFSSQAMELADSTGVKLFDRNELVNLILLISTNSSSSRIAE